MIRISSIGRMEYRLPDASVNPYMSHAVLIAAMEDGISNKIDPGAALGESGAALTFPELPLNLGDAITTFQSSDLMSSALPADFHDIFIQLKEDEWARFSGAVTDWERAMYWETLP
jgi:glutamine synthetase